MSANPISLLILSVAPKRGTPHTVQKRKIIPGTVLSGYADGTIMAVRIVPAEKNLVAFGDKPFM